MKFVIFHGAFGSPEGNWFPQLKDALLALGQEVLVPEFPCDDWNDIVKAGPDASNKHQTLSNWMKVFEKEVLLNIKKGEKLIFIGHSLSPVFILHVVSKFNLKLDSAIFVSPFLRDIGGKHWQFKVVNKTFYKKDFDFKKLQKLIPTSFVLYSDTDPYVDKKFFLEFSKKMNSSTILLKQAGHLNSEVNLNEFPLVYELCKTRLDLTLYQKYLAHRRELFHIDYIKPSEEVIYLKSSEIYDEGIFKFRNLSKGGFCTLLSSLKMWDTQSLYMKESRKAAKRTGNLSRVYVIKDASDLKRKLLKEQLTLDLESEVKVYFVKYSDIKNITKHPDFGLWDDDYLCTVDDEKKARLSSRKKDIARGQKWEKEILKLATRIKNASSDIKNFLLKNKF